MPPWSSSKSRWLERPIPHHCSRMPRSASRATTPDHRDGQRRHEDVVVLDVATARGRARPRARCGSSCSSSPVVTAIAALRGVAAGGERVGRRVVDDVEPRLRAGPRRCTGPRRGCGAGRTPRPSAGVARLMRSATASDFQYDAKAAPPATTQRDDDADRAAADQVGERGRRPAPRAATKPAMRSQRRRLLAVTWSYIDPAEVSPASATGQKRRPASGRATRRRPRSTRARRSGTCRRGCWPGSSGSWCCSGTRCRCRTAARRRCGPRCRSAPPAAGRSSGWP